MKRYISIWTKLTINSFLSAFSSRVGAFIFLLAKLLRFIFFGIFLLTLFSRVSLLKDYSLLEAQLFFLTFTVIDTTSQLFFREVYRFRQLVVSGDFDLVLTKPISPLFRALIGGADPLDLIMLLPYGAILIGILVKLPQISPITLGMFMGMVLNSFLLSAGFHIIVLSLAILTSEIDHSIMIYRDLTSMGRFPVDIYAQPLRSVITYMIPIGVMMTFPVKAFLGLLSPITIATSLILGCGFFTLSVALWRRALREYTSASS